MRPSLVVRTTAFTLAAALVLAAARPAVAGPPGKWTKVSDGNVVNINEAGLFRTGDDVLHIAFTRAKSQQDGIGHTRISMGGSSSGTSGRSWAAGIPSSRIPSSPTTEAPGSA
jgi:hypothetical protein